MVFWTFVQKTKKPVFEADEKFKTKNHKKPYKKPKANQKTRSPPKKSGFLPTLVTTTIYQ